MLVAGVPYLFCSLAVPGVWKFFRVTPSLKTAELPDAQMYPWEWGQGLRHGAGFAVPVLMS